MMESKHLFIGIDDTDNPESKGTGYFSRCLGHQLEKEGLGKILGISRHQLYRSISIPFTSRNNATCIELKSCSTTDALLDFIRKFIAENATPGSETGFCIASAEHFPKKAMDFGLKAQKKVVTSDQALCLASENNFHIEGITPGAHGIIGALAAIGLRATGNDGTLIWVKGYEINDMKGIFHAGEIYSQTRVDCIKTIDGFKIPVNATIEYSENIHPVIKENFVTLYVVEHPQKDQCDWKVVTGCN
ncbi:MAG: hypothetical protein CVU05_11540 [Bacteroidetes bacterium HGW-Bacteroidetes-21]|jgi:hypothetical protein|nr:MAG: hypothetical protein CVU05_11540 [Bacteroidetes bacterium HGW-Bacteroidetes-21]